jgi:hypothetical protein
VELRAVPPFHASVVAACYCDWMNPKRCWIPGAAGKPFEARLGEATAELVAAVVADQQLITVLFNDRLLNDHYVDASSRVGGSGTLYFHSRNDKSRCNYVEPRTAIGQEALGFHPASPRESRLYGRDFGLNSLH